MASDNFDELLREATDAARDGKVAAARRILNQLVKDDPNNVKVWMLMYRVSDNLPDKREALKQVLRIEPDNVRAKEQFDKLQARRGVDDDEVAPGVNRRQLMLIIAGVGGVIVVLLLVAFLIISGNNARNASITATAEAVSTALALAEVQPTFDFETQVAAETSVQEALLAQFTATPTPTRTMSGPPTLPPEFTKTFTPAPLMSPTPLAAPPAEAAGSLVAAGGVDIDNNSFLEIVTLPLNSSGSFRTISGGTQGRYPTAVNSGRIVYTFYVPETVEWSLEVIDLVNTTTQSLPETWLNSAAGRIIDADEAQISYDNTRMVFTASSLNPRRHIYLFDFNAIGADPVRQITTDDFDYAFPSLSPDGRTIISTRRGVNTLTGEVVTDLFLITLANGDLRPITADASASIETMARYSPDGREIVYAANAGATTPHDIFLRSSDGIGPALPVASSPADDILPVYSPDGRFIAFSSNRGGSRYNIYIYDKSNGALYQLTNGSDDFFVGGWLAP